MKAKKWEISRSPLGQKKYFHWDLSFIILIEQSSQQGRLSTQAYFTAKFNMERLFFSIFIFQSIFLWKNEVFPPSHNLKDGRSEWHLLYSNVLWRDDSLYLVNVSLSTLPPRTRGSFIVLEMLAGFSSCVIPYHLPITFPEFGVDVYFQDMHLFKKKKKNRNLFSHL